MTKSKHNYAHLLVWLIFLGLSGWWALNFFTAEAGGTTGEKFSDSYWVLALVGGLIGLFAAKKWGGLKSTFGRSIYLFAFGLLAQVFGQVVYTYYAQVQHVEAPYPSVGDIGYFGSVLLYIGAVWQLAKTAGAKFNHADLLRKAVAVVLPLGLLLYSYKVFLQEYVVDWSSPFVVILDFGYPLGQSIYLSLAILTYLLSRGLLGGLMKNKVLFILGALLVQYSADYAFLYRFNRETWYPGDISDFLYLLAYFLMALALLKLSATANSLAAADKQQEM